MPIKEPTSASECVYFTNRELSKGYIKAWVFKGLCKKCNANIMEKPRDKKGKIKIREKEYICSACGNTENEKEYLERLTANVKYKCPFCSYEDEIQLPFKRKKVRINNEEGNQKTVESLRFQCSKCSKNIDITKRMV